MRAHGESAISGQVASRHSATEANEEKSVIAARADEDRGDEIRGDGNARRLGPANAAGMHFRGEPETQSTRQADALSSQDVRVAELGKYGKQRNVCQQKSLFVNPDVRRRSRCNPERQILRVAAACR